ncbi:MAG: hypothetical protein FWD69_07350 [Polyangiaceae bacterium]|nr:hypothetical protein [Polyangiaceae bacterium]
MRKDAPLAVDVPSTNEDKPGWVKVGVIAAVGFTIGVAWPRIAGVRLGPSAPGDSTAASAPASASGKLIERAPEAPTASVAGRVAPASSPSASATANVASASSAPSPAGPAASTQVTVQRGVVLSCKTDEGETKKGRECGGVASLDALIRPRLRELGTCSAANGQNGKLSLVVAADFGNSRLSWDIGKSSTIANVDGVTACLKTIFHSAGLSGVTHEHARYTVAYAANFAPLQDASTAPSDSAKSDNDDRKSATPMAASGEASITWEVALVRDAPKTGSVVARLPRGTKVKIGATKEGFYAVKFGDGFISDGWVYRGALSR